MSTQQEQELRLQQEILSEAQKRADRVVARAEADTKASLAQAEADNAKMRESALAEARANAERKSRNIIRGIWMEQRRLWLSEREKCLDECFAEVLAQAQALPTGDSRRAASLAALAKEAMDSIQAPAVTAVIAPQDSATVTTEWLLKVCGNASKGVSFTVRVDDKMKGGIRLESQDGSRVYDNSYSGRMARLREQFRREIAMQSDIFTEDTNSVK